MVRQLWNGPPIVKVCIKHGVHVVVAVVAHYGFQTTFEFEVFFERVHEVSLDGHEATLSQAFLHFAAAEARIVQGLKSAATFKTHLIEVEIRRPFCAFFREEVFELGGYPKIAKAAVLLRAAYIFAGHGIARIQKVGGIGNGVIGAEFPPYIRAAKSQSIAVVQQEVYPGPAVGEDTFHLAFGNLGQVGGGLTKEVFAEGFPFYFTPVAHGHEGAKNVHLTPPGVDVPAKVDPAPGVGTCTYATIVAQAFFFFQNNVDNPGGTTARVEFGRRIGDYLYTFNRVGSDLVQCEGCRTAIHKNLG